MTAGADHGDIDALASIADGALRIGERIDAADDVGVLRPAARSITDLVAQFHRAGLKVAPIAAIAQALNTRLFDRTWRMIAPPDLVAGSCLFVMGSEGRGEQILKTDQDNGLVLRDDAFDSGAVERACKAFSEALGDFGYPPCPGGIMVSNPQWRHSADDFGRTVRRWLAMPDANSLMSLAIFLDARAVCGDGALLERVRDEIFAMAAGSDAMLGRFAASVDAFSSESGWWNRWLPLADHHEQVVDLKKLGVFPLVHGVRSMALQQQLRETSTVERIEALAASGQLARESASELTETLHFLMELKLKVGLSELELGRPVSGVVHPDELGSLDRIVLKHALGVVTQFRVTLRRRFHLDALS